MAVLVNEELKPEIIPLSKGKDGQRITKAT
jgi:hypothetical protein